MRKMVLAKLHKLCLFSLMFGVVIVSGGHGMAASLGRLDTLATAEQTNAGTLLDKLLQQFGQQSIKMVCGDIFQLILDVGQKDITKENELLEDLVQHILQRHIGSIAGGREDYDGRSFFLFKEKVNKGQLLNVIQQLISNIQSKSALVHMEKDSYGENKLIIDIELGSSTQDIAGRKFQLVNVDFDSGLITLTKNIRLVIGSGSDGFFFSSLYPRSPNPNSEQQFDHTISVIPAFEAVQKKQSSLGWNDYWLFDDVTQASEVAKLEQQLKLSSAQLNALISEKRKLEAENAELSKQLKDLKVQSEKWKIQLRSNEQSFIGKKEEIEKLHKEIKTIQSASKNIEFQKDISEGKLKEMQRNLDQQTEEHQASTQRFQEEIVALKARIAEERGNIQKELLLQKQALINDREKLLAELETEKLKSAELAGRFERVQPGEAQLIRSEKIQADNLQQKLPTENSNKGKMEVVTETVLQSTRLGVLELLDQLSSGVSGGAISDKQTLTKEDKDLREKVKNQLVVPERFTSEEADIRKQLVQLVILAYNVPSGVNDVREKICAVIDVIRQAFKAGSVSEIVTLKDKLSKDMRIRFSQLLTRLEDCLANETE